MTKRDILYFFFKWQASILTVFVLIVSSVTLFVYIMPAKYTGRAKVLVEPNRSPAMRTDISPSLQRGEAIFTEIEIILSHSVMASVVDKLKPYARGPEKETYFGNALRAVSTKFKELGLTISMEPRDWWIRYLLKHVEVDPVINSNILEIAFKDKDAKWASLIVNEIIDSYTQHHFKIFASVENSIMYKKPMEKSEIILEQKRKELIEFKKKYSIAAINEKKLGLARSISSLREQLTDSRVRLAELKDKYKSGHPAYKEVLWMKSKIHQLTTSVSEANSQLNELEVKIDQVDALEQEIESKKKTYEDHRRKYEAASILEFSNLDQINVRVVDYSPIPVRPDFSNLFYIAISIILGFIFAVTIAIIKEYFDNRVTDPGEVERMLGLPEIGSLEKFGKRHIFKISS